MPNNVYNKWSSNNGIDMATDAIPRQPKFPVVLIPINNPVNIKKQITLGIYVGNKQSIVAGISAIHVNNTSNLCQYGCIWYA